MIENIDIWQLQQVEQAFDLIYALKTLKQEGYKIKTDIREIDFSYIYSNTADIFLTLLESIFDNVYEGDISDVSLAKAGFNFYYEDLQDYRDNDFRCFKIYDKYIEEYTSILKRNGIQSYDKEIIKALSIDNTITYNDEYECCELFLGDDMSGLWLVVSYCNSIDYTFVTNKLISFKNKLKSLVDSYYNNNPIEITVMTNVQYRTITTNKADKLRKRGFGVYIERYGNNKRVYEIINYTTFRICDNMKPKKVKFRKRSYFKRLKYNRLRKLKGAGVIVK